MREEVIRLRRARSVVVLLDEPTPRALHFVTGAELSVDPLGFSLLSESAAWVEPESLIARLEPSFSRDRIARSIISLLDSGLMVSEGSAVALADAELERFPWGPTAGIFHYTIKNARYAQPDAQNTWIEQRVISTPLVPLFDARVDGEPSVALSPPHVDELFSVLARRRSYRGFADRPLRLDALSECLFAGLGIVGFIETPTPSEGRLPISMTPSGGARNPYEAYVIARDVAGLKSGVYHYAAIDHSLSPRSVAKVPDLASLLGQQAWFAAAAAVILLVAHFDRTAWKYPHPGGLRVVLIEAGHIAQNILLVATKHGLAAAPTCAISDIIAEEACGLDLATQAAVYAIAIGERSEALSNADPHELLPNERSLMGRQA